MVQPSWLGYPNIDRRKSGKAYEDAVDSLTRLAQHLNGLRSGTRLQHDLTKAHQNGKIVLKRKSSKTSRTYFEARSAGIKGKSVDNGQGEATPADAMLQAAAYVFGELVDELGPPLNALSVCIHV